jgi:hypothetical protein
MLRDIYSRDLYGDIDIPIVVDLFVENGLIRIIEAYENLIFVLRCSIETYQYMLNDKALPINEGVSMFPQALFKCAGISPQQISRFDFKGVETEEIDSLFGKCQSFTITVCKVEPKLYDVFRNYLLAKPEFLVPVK